MSGQKNWGDAGSGQNDYVVKEQIAHGVERFAEMASVFGQLNAGREIKTTVIEGRTGNKTIDGGNDSPVFVKPLIENSKAIFTLEEPTSGMPTYGDVDVKPGPYLEYLHSECYVRSVSSPAYPIPGFESLKNFERVQKAEQVIQSRKQSVILWQSREVDLDAFRALFMGASRGILTKEDGAMGATLFGALAGQYRAPWNTLVAGNNALTATDVNATQHNLNLATLLAALTDDEKNYFNYQSHQNISQLIGSDLRFKEVTVFGKKFRAVVLIDEWDLRSLRNLKGDLNSLFRDVDPRDEKSRAIYHMNELVLDGILYVPTPQLKFFRPSVTGSGGSLDINWGCGMNKDPRSRSFKNDSNITPCVVMGAGALLRAHRKDASRFTVEVGKHGKGTEYSYHYDDGWTRHDWAARDGRDIMENDSSLVLFHWARNPLELAA